MTKLWLPNHEIGVPSVSTLYKIGHFSTIFRVYSMAICNIGRPLKGLSKTINVFISLQNLYFFRPSKSVHINIVPKPQIAMKMITIKLKY